MIGKIKKFLLAAVLSITVLGFSPKASATAALINNGSDPLYYQGSISSITSSQLNNGVSPGNGNYMTVQGHMYQNTQNGSLLVCTISDFVNTSSSYTPIFGPPITPGFTWVFAGSKIGDAYYIAGPDGGYLTYDTSVYYLFLGANGNPSVMTTGAITTQTTTFVGTYHVPPLINDTEISIGFEITEWGGVPPSDKVTVLTAKGTSDTPDGGNIITPAATDLLIVSGSSTGNDVWNSVGVGYIGLDDLANINTGSTGFPVVGDLITEYMLNAAAGTYDTDFSGPSDFAYSWSIVAVAFSQAAITPPPPITYQYGIQPWETTEGEVSLDTLNVNVNIPVVDKDGVGLPFAFALNFNNNFWFLGNCDNSSVDPGVTCWQPNSNNFGWMPDASQIYGAYVAIPTFCPDSVGNGGSAALDFVAYQDPQGNMHPIDPNTVISFSGNACNYPSTKAVVSTDGSGYTYNLAFPTDGQTFNNVDQAIPIVGTGTPQVVASNGTVMTPGIIYYNNPGALGNSTVPWGMPNYITGISSKDTNSNTISTPAQLSWPVHHIVPVGPWTFTDTVGVGEVTVAPETFVGPPNSQLLGPSGPGGPCAAGGTQTYTYPTSTGTASATVGCQQYTIATNFQCTVFDTATQAYVNAYEWPFIDHVSSFQAYLPSSVTLADGSQYQFTYESQLPGTTSGRLANITYPDGSVVYYAYPGANNGTNCYDGSLIGLTRTSPDGVTNYSRTQTGVAVGSHLYNTTTVVGPAPAYNTSVYTFNQQPAGYYQSEFMVQEVDYQGLSTLNNPLKSVVYCYNGNQSNCVTASAPTYPITQKDIYTTLAGVGTSSRVSKTYDSYGNTTGVALYDFGASTPTRNTVLSNFGQSWNGSTASPACTTIGNGVNNVPCQAEVFNSAGTPIGNTFYSYGSTGNSTSVSRWASGSITGGVYLKSSAAYNSNGTTSAFTDETGNISTYSYSSGICNGGFPVALSFNPSARLSLADSFTWDFGCKGAVLTSATDPNGKVVTAEYNDPFWRNTKVTDQENNSGNKIYTPTTVESIFSFQSNSSIVDTYHQSNPSALTAYDQQLESPKSESWDSIVSGWNWGNTGIVSYGYVPCTGPKATNCATIGLSTTTSDALGRPLATIDGGGGTTNNTYVGQDILSVSGPAPIGEVIKQVQTEYNGLGQIVSICEISNASAPLIGAVSCSQANGGYSGYLTSYTYNANGTLASVSKASGGGTQTHSFTYDIMGRMLTETYPESGTTTYIYDSSSGTCSVSAPGQLVRVNDANGNQACYTYDGLNRKTSITYTGPNFDGYNQYFVYDSATVNGVIMTNVKGHLAEAYTAAFPRATKITDEGFGYTARGEISDVYEYIPSAKVYQHVAATYYANGALNSISGIPGGPWTYSIDGKGRPYGATDGSSTVLVSGTTYNAADQPLVLTYGSGDTDTYTYDSLTNRMTSYAFTIGATPVTNAGLLTWNANGTLRSLAITDGINVGGTQTCNYGSASIPGYDVIGRLLSVVCANGSTNLWAQNFSYDAFNNLTKTVPSGTYTYTPTTWNPGYSSSTNRPIGTTADSNGNLLTDTFHTYTWNQNNKVIGITDAGVTAKYDAAGNMVERYDGATYTQPILSPIGSLGLWSGKSVQQFRIPLPGGATAVTGTDFWHTDWLGSVRLVSGLTGRHSVTGKSFAPYGESYAVFPTGNTSDLNFTGDNQDLVAGTYDTPSRELNSNQGRWISPDPAHSGWNGYAYSTNPLGVTDSSGNQDDQADATLSTCGGNECATAPSEQLTDSFWNIDFTAQGVDLSGFGAHQSLGVDGSTQAEYSMTSDTDFGDPEIKNMLQALPLIVLDATLLSAGGGEGLLSEEGAIRFGGDAAGGSGAQGAGGYWKSVKLRRAEWAAQLAASKGASFGIGPAGIEMDTAAAARAAARAVENSEINSEITTLVRDPYLFDPRGKTLIFNVSEAPTPYLGNRPMGWPSKLGSAGFGGRTAPASWARTGYSVYQENFEKTGFWRTSDHWGVLGTSKYVLNGATGGVEVEPDFWIFEQPITGFTLY